MSIIRAMTFAVSVEYSTALFAGYLGDLDELSHIYGLVLKLGLILFGLTCQILDDLVHHPLLDLLCLQLLLHPVQKQF